MRVSGRAKRLTGPSYARPGARLLQEVALLAVVMVGFGGEELLKAEHLHRHQLYRGVQGREGATHTRRLKPPARCCRAPASACAQRGTVPAGGTAPPPWSALPACCQLALALARKGQVPARASAASERTCPANLPTYTTELLPEEIMFPMSSCCLHKPPRSADGCVSHSSGSRKSQARLSSSKAATAVTAAAASAAVSMACA